MNAQRRAEQAIAQVAARSWSDVTYRRELLQNPGGILRAAGLDIPAGTRVHVHEQTEGERHIVIPARPVGLGNASVLTSGHIMPQFCTIFLTLADFRRAMRRLARGGTIPGVPADKLRAMKRALPLWRKGKAAQDRLVAKYKAARDKMYGRTGKKLAAGSK